MGRIFRSGRGGQGSAACRRTLTFAVCCLTLAACGSGGHSTPTTTSTSSTIAPSTAAGPQKTSIDVVPPSGPTGTTFQLHGRFSPQEKVAFEIDLPNGKTFKGQSHTSSADGSVSTSYRTTATDPAGTYQVQATGDQGEHLTGQFDVTAAGAPPATRPRGTTSTAGKQGSTTLLRGSTSTKKP